MDWAEVRQRRRAAGWTQEKLAKLGKSTREIVAQGETGLTVKVPEGIAAVAAALPPVPLPPTPISGVSIITSGSSATVSIVRFDGTTQRVVVTEGYQLNLTPQGDTELVPTRHR